VTATQPTKQTLPEILERWLQAAEGTDGRIGVGTVRELMKASYSSGRFDGMAAFFNAGRKQEAL